jgi:hypothetical protein
MDSFINAGKQFLQDQSKDDNKKGTSKIASDIDIKGKRAN